MAVPTFSCASPSAHVPLVSVETHLSPALPAFNLVGLPETAMRESKVQVRSAIINTDFKFPTRSRWITVNLAPGDLPQHGTRFDLAIPHGILAASTQIPNRHPATTKYVAEPTLTGALRLVRGIPPREIAAQISE